MKASPFPFLAFALAVSVLFVVQIPQPNEAIAFDDDDAGPPICRDQDCIRAWIDMDFAGPWSDGESYADGFKLDRSAGTIEYNGQSYNVTETLPGSCLADPIAPCLLSWTEGETARELFPEFDEMTESYSVYPSLPKAKFDDGSGMSGWNGTL